MQFRAHVIVCEALMGKTPPGYVVAHACGNKSCVAPNHLSMATYQENGQDAVRHGDLICKLSAQDVYHIRQSCDSANASSLQAAAKNFQVSIACIKNIIKGRSWSWLNDLMPKCP